MSDSSESVRIADSFARREGGVRTEAGKSSDEVLTTVVPFLRSVGDRVSAVMAEEDGFAIFSVDPDAIKSLSFPEEEALPSAGLFDLMVGNNGLKESGVVLHGKAQSGRGDRPLKCRKV